MRLHKSIIYFIQTLVLWSVLVIPSFAGNGYGPTPAIVQIPGTGQHDSVGFNIVDELPSILYNRIISGEIRLYINPLKDSLRDPRDLIAIEKATKTSFQEVDGIFLDEDWTMKGKKFTFDIRGIFCLNRSAGGVQVNYGYIDIEEVMGLLKSFIVKTNANGPKNLTFWDALQSRRYNFNLVKFGGENFSKNPERSIELRIEAFHNPKVTTNALILNEVKEVEYTVNNVDFTDAKSNSTLFKAVEGYFKQNPQEFYNLGGAEFEDFLNVNATLHLTKIEVTETWRKTETGITYQLDEVVFYVNGHALEPISASALSQMGFIVNFQRMEDYLKEKSFFFTIMRINEQVIYGHLSQDVLNALLTGSWNKILITEDNK